MAQSKRTSASYLAESRNTKPLSKAMYNWAKANMSKLKQPTKAQKKIFEKRIKIDQGQPWFLNGLPLRRIAGKLVEK